MKPRRVAAIARKEFLHIRRDPRSLLLGVGLPLLLLLLFGYALTLDVDNVPLVVWDQSQTPESRELVSRFGGSRYFEVRRHVASYPEIEHVIDTGETLAALVIPVTFAGDIASGRGASAQFLLDGSDSNTATIALGYAEAVARAYARDILLRATLRAGGRAPEAALDLRPRVWFNADMESRNFVIPGLIAVIMMVVAALLTSLTIAREWETGTMEQLVSTPIRRGELILGKLIPYFLIGALDMVVAVAAGRYVFDVPLRGSLATLAVMAVIFLAGALSFGLFISVITKSQILASQLAMFTTFLPAFLLSGFMYDIANMPKVIQVVTHVIPASYYVTILRAIYLKGVGLEAFWGSTLFLSAYGAIFLVLSIRKFRKTVA